METIVQPSPIPAASDPHNPTATKPYTQEIRFAVVMYGGVSLAIYINGVAQELFNLIRATATQSPDGSPLYSIDKLRPSQRVYRKLGQMMAYNQPLRYTDLQNIPDDASIQTRFVVDILSGTSAGGINAIYLAKALANDQDFSVLAKLWREEADLGKLINDAASVEHTGPKQQVPPKSLLNSQRMYRKLLEALELMEESNSSGRALVDDLDLHITATYIAGQVINLPLADKTDNNKPVKERRHRAVFHFRHTHAEDSDFGRVNNPFLAFVARCTSAFPVAFEPMRLKYIDEVVGAFKDYRQSNHTGWYPFYRSFLPQPLDSSDPTVEQLVEQFGSIDFSDGGVLDNFPFGYAIDAIPLRDAELPVDRKLVYIEPAPTHPELEPDPKQAPSFVASGWSALSTLPRYETIREDLQRVIARNQLIERVKRIVEGLELDRRHSDSWQPPLERGDWKKLTLADMLTRMGLAWSGYQHLRVAEVTDDLARLIARANGIDEKTNEFKSIRESVRCWRRKTYDQEAAALDEVSQGEGQSSSETKKYKSSGNEFLTKFDYLWRLRRLKFVFARLDDIACLDRYQPDNRKAPQNQRWEIIQGFARSEEKELIALPSNEGELAEFREKLRQIKAALHQAYIVMRKKRRVIWHESRKHDHNGAGQARTDAEDKEPKVLHDAIKKLGNGAGQAHTVVEDQEHEALHEAIKGLGISREELRSAMNEDQIQDFYTLRKGKFASLATSVEGILERIFSDARKSSEEALNRDRDKVDIRTAKPSEILAMIVARHYFDYFDDYDMIIYPIIYATQVGDELDPIDVFRISPEDAGSLRSSTPDKPKLAGTLLQNFGAFFKRGFRENDIVWGRLDGAERLISALLPDPRDKIVRDQLIEEAHVAIIVDEVLGENVSYKQKKATEEFLLKRNTDTGSPSNGHEDAGYNELLKGIEGCLSQLAPPRPQKGFAGWITKVRRGRLNQLPAPSALASASYLWHETERDYFKRTRATTDRELVPADTVRMAARASMVFGQMLEDYSKQQPSSEQRRLMESSAQWVTRLARIFWGVVEVAVPGSLPHLVFYHALKLLYLFEMLMIVLGALLVNQTIQQFGMVAFGITHYCGPPGGDVAGGVDD